MSDIEKVPLFMGYSRYDMFLEVNEYNIIIIRATKYS